jgi:hypothetical protein
MENLEDGQCSEKTIRSLKQLSVFVQQPSFQRDFEAKARQQRHEDPRGEYLELKESLSRMVEGLGGLHQAAQAAGLSAAAAPSAHR